MSDNHVRFAESLHNEQLKFAPNQITPAIREGKALADVPPRTPGVMDEQFPTASLTAYEPEKDREMVAKLQLGEVAQKAGAPVGYTPFGKMEAKKEDFDWYQRKQAAAEVANFQRWFAKEFDLMDPAQKKRAKELYPEFYAQRKKLLKQQAKNLVRLAKIKLEGIQSFNDLQTQYLAETGRLDVGPLEHLLKPESGNSQNSAYQKYNFVRGLANPFLVYGKMAYPDNSASRVVQQNAYEVREFSTPDTVNLGYNTGFPPMGYPDQGQQGDKEWYKVLGTMPF